MEGTFKAGVIDPVTELFVLLSIWFWLEYLNQGSRWQYAAAFASFLVALFSKEIAVNYPVILLLFDRFFIRRPASVSDLVSRYFAFCRSPDRLHAIEYIVTRRSVLSIARGIRLEPVRSVILSITWQGLFFPGHLCPY